MKTIVFPAKLNAQGPVVATLHTALGLLGFEVDPNEKRREFFGEKTAALIKVIQTNLGVLRPTGEVDQELAVMLNKLVGEKELIDAIGQDGALAKALATDGALAKALATDGALAKALGAEGVLNKALGAEGLLVKALAADGALAKALATDGALAKALGAEGVLNKALGAEGLLVKALAADGALAKALATDGALAKALGAEGVLNKALGAEGLLVKALAADGALAKALATDGALAKVLGAEGVLNKALGAEGLLVKALAADGALAKALAADGALTTALSKKGDLYELLNGLTGDQSFVRGRVLKSTGKPLSGCVVRVFHVTDKGKASLGQDTTDIEGSYCVRYARLAKSESVHLAIVAMDGHGQPICEPVLRENAGPQEVVDLKVRVDTKPKSQHWIEGQILLDDGREADGLTLRLYRRRFGLDDKKLAEAPSDERGHYALPYDPEVRAASLEIRAVVNGDEVPLCRPLNDLGERAEINLVAPSSLKPLSPDSSEYGRLKNDLKDKADVCDMAKLAEAKEQHGRQDLTVLSGATGWDARLIALAAFASRLGADAEVALSQKALYGLLRVGLPSDKLLLAQVDPAVAKQALEKAWEAGIVDLSDEDVAQFKKQFSDFANRVRLNTSAPGSKSTYHDMLKASGLSDDAQSKFASVYFSDYTDASALWAGAKKAGLNDTEIRKLQLQGKLACVSANSHQVTERLLNKNIKDPVELVGQGLHRPDGWIAELREIAENDEKKLNALIPTAYVAERTEDRLIAYAEDMARKVRLSYPTQVIGQLMKDGQIKLPANHDATVKMLQHAAMNGFRLGQTTVEAFFRARMSKKNLEAARPQIQQLKKLQRIYQITPCNEAMPVLMALNVTSAYDVTAYPKALFVERYKAKYQEIHKKEAPKSEAELIYRKSTQVSSITYNLFAIAKKLDSEPPVAGMSAPVEVYESVRNELIKRFPTMESLFGSMDFCECEHCRSVLSPAAYLVDLLQFIDAEPQEWGNFLEHWKQEHGKQGYPHKDRSGKAMKPYDVLVERRPDLPHIALTCENTHTAVPYIDIVNEILEYYVANRKLAADAAHDTGDATTAELLAEPQNIIAGAYQALNEAKYPINLPSDLVPETAPKPLALPFDLWIETVRKFCDYFETPLAKILEVFRSTDDLFAPTRPFDRASIFMESLGLSPAEVALFTDPDPLSSGKWHELYGYPSARPAIQNPTNAGQATLSVANDQAGEFRPGLACTYFDVSAGNLSGESKNIASIGDPDSGGAGQTLITFAGAWTAPPVVNDLLVCDASAMLSSAKTLSRRLGVTYKEIAEIVRTGFVNPKLTDLALLYKLGVSVRDAAFFKSKKATHAQLYTQNKNLLEKDRTEWTAADLQQAEAVSEVDWKILLELYAFRQRLQHFAAENPIPGLDANALETQIDQIALGTVLELADPDAVCNFVLTTLRYADGTKAKPIDFLRINLFVRLWRKLGWSIKETDRSLQSFIPATALFEEAKLNQRPLRTGLIYLAHLKALEEKVSLGKQGRIKLISLWSDIATTGQNPLYAQLFLNRSMLRSGEVEVIVGEQAKSLSIFDDPLGHYLDPAQLLKIAEQVRHEVRLPEVLAANQINPAPFAGETRLVLRYDALEEVQYLSYSGVLSDQEKARLAALAPSPTLSQLLDDVQSKGRDFCLVKGHSLALQGALGLTADEIQSILDDAGKNFATAELSLPNVSLLFRYGLLARALKLEMRELIALKQLCGIDPFKPLYADPLATLDQDYPFSQTLEFVKVAEEVKDSGLKVEDLDYLLRHRFDQAGKYRVDPASRLALLKALSEGVRAIRGEHAVPDDPGAIGEDVLRQKLGLVLPADVVATFMSMMNGTAQFIANKLVANADQLYPADFAGESSFSVSTYNGAKGEQGLLRRGILFAPETAKLKARYGAKLSPGQKATFDALLNDAQTGSQQESHAFFDKHLLKQADVQPVSGFLDATDYDLLFVPGADGISEAERQALEKARRAQLAKAFLPFLQDRLITQFIVQTMTAQTGADQVLVESQITDARLLGTPEPLLKAYAATGDRGIASSYWFSADQSGVKLTTLHRPAEPPSAAPASSPFRSVGAAHAEIIAYIEVPKDDDYTFSVVLIKKDDRAVLRIVDSLIDKIATHDGEEFASAPVPLKWGERYPLSLTVGGKGAQDVSFLVESATLPKSASESCRLDGYLQVPVAGAYRFRIELDKQNAEAELRFPHRPEPVFLKGTAANDNSSIGDKPGDYLELNAGVPYRFALDLKKLNGGVARLLVQGKTLPMGPLSPLTLYSAAAMDAADRATTLLTKALQLAQSQSLSEREIRYLLLNAADFDGLSFSELPTEEVGDLPADMKQRFGRFRRLAAYVRLKRELAAGTDDLISVFEANPPAAATTQEKEQRLDAQVYPLIAKLTRREPATVRAAAKSLVAASAIPAFLSEQPLQRLWEALQVIERFGVPVASLREWTRIVSAAATPEQRFAIAHDLKEAIKARFELETWRRVAQPIFDKLRQRQRDALVSHVAHRLGFEQMEQLYEFFLIDPGMEPVVQTSRIRLAIASLQLFIQRSLLNLELKVEPSVINAKQWEWMKRYRVWETNRKIFLYPENWLEPEFRDDKTHLFTELEGALLQGDVSSDLVEDAFLNYLRKLDELARLDIVAMHVEDNADPALRVLHVIGRTYSEPHKYFYRRYAHQMWTAWEPVSAEIEGDHLAPVVWRYRLYLFWVTFMDKPVQDASPDESETKLADLTLSGAVSGMQSMTKKKHVELQLHWSEYLQGDWSTHESGGFGATLSPPVPMDFDRKSVYIHVSKEPYENGEEKGVYVHLGGAGGAVNQAFYLAGRNSAPEEASYGTKPANPYSAGESSATRYSGSGKLTVEFKQQVITEPSPHGTTFEFVLDPKTRDLFVIKKNNTGTRSTEVHVLSAKRNYGNFIRHAGTALHETDASFQFLLDAKQNLLAIKKSNTGTHKTEVHRLSERSEYQAFDLHTPTALPETDETFEFLLDRKGNLYAIKKSNTTSDHVTYQRFSGQTYYELGPETQTALLASDGVYDVRIARVLVSEETDVIALQTPKNHNKAIQLKILSAKSDYKVVSLEAELPLKAPTAALSFLQDQKNNLYAILPAGGRDAAELHIFSAKSGYQKSTRKFIKLPRESVTSTSVTPEILGQGGKLTLLPCDNDIVLGAPAPDSITAENVGAVAAVVGRDLSEIASLVKPVFYQDNSHTLFVEPNVTERTIEDHQAWVMRTVQPEPAAESMNKVSDIVVIPAIPWRKPSVAVWAGRDGIPIGSVSLIKVKPEMDWLTNPVTGLIFDGAVVGPSGRVGLEVRPAGEMVDSEIQAGVPVNIHAGSGLAADSGAVIARASVIEESGLSLLSGSLNIVGGAGFNAALAQNFAGAGRSGPGSARPAASRTER